MSDEIPLADLDPPMRASRFRPTSRLLAVAVLAALLLGAATSGAPAPDRWSGTLAVLGRGGLVAFMLAGATLVSLGLPKTAVSITAGTLFGLWTGTFAIVGVAALAASWNYGLARWLFADWVLRRLRASRRLEGVDRVAAEGGFRLQLLFRLAPLHTVLISYAMGAVGAPFATFLAAAVVGVLGQVLWIHVGATANVAAAEGASAASWISLGIAITSAAVLAIYLPRLAARKLPK